MSAEGCVNHGRCYSKCDKSWWCYREQRRVDAQCGAAAARDDRDQSFHLATLDRDQVEEVSVREEVTS